MCVLRVIANRALWSVVVTLTTAPTMEGSVCSACSDHAEVLSVEGGGF